MLKESLKMYLDKYFDFWIKERGSYPMVPFDSEEESTLYFGEVDKEEYVQWKYKEIEQKIDFDALEKKYGVELPLEIKEYYNSYYFLQLEGFINGKHISMTPIEESTDIIGMLEYYLSEENGMIALGTYGEMDLQLSIELETGTIIAYDYEWESKSLIADSLTTLFNQMLPKR